MTQEEAKLVTKGNELAERFVIAFVAYCHMLDDVIDKDNPIDDERLIAENIRFLNEMLINPWVRENQALLWPLIITSFNSWLDANDWEFNDLKEKRRDADVIKGMYHEVVWFVAYLCGGWEHLRTITSKYREYDHNYKEEGT